MVVVVMVYVCVGGWGGLVDFGAYRCRTSMLGDGGGGRYGGSELHSIAAVIGGVGAQEVTKVLLRQFVPAGGTFVFNGVTGKSAVCCF